MHDQQKRNLKLFSPADQQKKAQELRETFRFLSPIFSHQQSEQEKLENQLLLLQESIQKRTSYLFFLSETERNYKNKADRSSLWLSQYFRNLVHRCPLFTSKTNTQFSFRSNGYITARTRILYKAERFFLYKAINLKAIGLLRFIYCFHLILHIRLLSPATFFIDSYEHRDNSFHVFLKSRNIDEVFQWVFSWGSQVQVLEPKILSEKIRDEAKKNVKTLISLLT